jgi:hypothetical protein
MVGDELGHNGIGTTLVAVGVALGVLRLQGERSRRVLGMAFKDESHGELQRG